MKTKIIIATIKSWNIEEAHRFAKNNITSVVKLITSKEELNYNDIKSFNPKYIFSPHWS